MHAAPEPPRPRERGDLFAGVLLGTALGDALGLPREGLRPGRARRLFGTELRHRFLFGRGMVSDDTEHTCLVGQALLAAPDDPSAFARSLGWRLRGWLLGLPAGVGLATLRALCKLWLGFPPQRSGVFSAGNGPAMRSALLGLVADGARLRALVEAATRLTHTDPKATEGALLVARAARLGAREGPGLDPLAALDSLREGVEGEELAGHLERARAGLEGGESAAAYAAALGLERGVSGYINHTVPVALYGWLRHPGDFRAALAAVIALGGDADTSGAIVGALAGATVGAAGLPADWLAGLWEWPRSVPWMRRLAGRLARTFPGDGSAPERPGPLRLFWPALLLRAPLFLVVVLLHGFRRLFPPYGGLFPSPTPGDRVG